MAAPPILDLSRDDPQEALELARRALDRGELVVVPTETVYGLALRDDRPDALVRLAAIKAGRSQPYSLAVDSIDRLVDRLAPLPATARRMAARWWPGPVTQVLATRTGSTLGVRVPGNGWTRDLVAAVGAPLLLPSANRPGEPPPVTVEDLDATLLDQVALVVDGGRAALGQSSTVVRPGCGCLQILREGVVSRDDLRRHAAGKVAVVCSGNTCRSPMARALLEQAFAQREQRDPGFVAPRVVSAGLFASYGSEASPAAVSVLAERELDLAGHRSTPVSWELLAEVDQVLTMTLSQLAGVVELAPDLDFPVELFDPDGAEVQDPFGGEFAVYAACADSLATMAHARAERACTTPREPVS